MSVDLSTTYLGLKLKNPLVVAACPLAGDIEVMERLEEAGAAAIVMPSLFEEQIEHDQLEMHAVRTFGSESFAEALDYFPEQDDYRTGPEQYLQTMEAAKKKLHVPIMGSLNGTSDGGWVRYAKMMQEAGADALELNIYHIAADLDASGADVEKRHCDLIAKVKDSVNIPLAVKVGPYFSSIGHVARQMAEAGADGLVLFNRFLQPRIDIDALQVSSKLVLSTPFELLLPVRWIAILRGRVQASLAHTSGVHSSEGAIQSLLAGADVVQVASMLYKDGIHRLGAILDELAEWMEEKEYDSVEQLKGSMSQQNCPDPEAFERGNYMKALTSFTGVPI